MCVYLCVLSLCFVMCVLFVCDGNFLVCSVCSVVSACVVFVLCFCSVLFV